MKNKTKSFAKIIPFTIPLLMALSLILILKSSFFMQHAEILYSAITIDFLVIIPFVYFLLIRKKEIPKITVLTSFIIGLVVLSFMLPSEHQSLLSHVKTYFLPLIELGIISFVIYNVIKLRKRYRSQKNQGDFYTVLNKVTKEILPKTPALILTTEISLIYYAFIKWRSDKRSKNQFTYHKSNGLVSIIAGFTLVICIETVALHSILTKWNLIFGWIITFLSAYTALQFFALAKSVIFRPHQIDNENKNIDLKFGYFTELTIPIYLIQSLEMNSKDLPEDKSVTYFSPLGMLGGHNMILHLKEEIQFSGIYGIKRKAKSLAIHLDEKGVFYKTVLENL